MRRQYPGLGQSCFRSIRKWPLTTQVTRRGAAVAVKRNRGWGFGCAAVAFVVLLITLPVNFLFAKSWDEQPISADYKICINKFDDLTIRRFDAIDVEKVYVSKGGKIFAEFVFDEMGAGAYSKMIQDAALEGVMLHNGSHIVVYGQLFHRDGLFFIAKSTQPSLPPVWIYAKFFGETTLEVQSAALRLMTSLKPCH